MIVEPDWRSVLAASVVDKPLMVSSELDERVERFVDRHNPEKVYAVGGFGQDPSLNVTNLEREGIIPVFFPNASRYVRLGEDRERSLTAAQYAAAEEIPVGFGSYESMESVNMSEEELERKYMEGREEIINHIVLANTDSPSSALASRYAVRNDAFIVAASAEVTYGSEVEENNEKNNVAAFRQELQQALEMLERRGLHSSPEYMRNGLYLTVFGAPFKERKDPVEDSTFILFDDEKDRDFYFSDRPYIDVNGDERVDMRYGRIPSDMETAFEVLNENTSQEQDAVVAAEYAKATWPEVLAYRGGGLWHAKQLRADLEEQGKNVTSLVESRAGIPRVEQAIRSLVFSLLGIPDPAGPTAEKVLIDAYREVKEGDLQDGLYSVVSNADVLADKVASESDEVSDATGIISSSTLKSGAEKVSSVVGRVKTVQSLTKLLQGYLEHEVDFRQDEMEAVVSDIDEYDSIDGAAQALLGSLLQPYEPLNASTLNSSIDGSGMVYYIGKGNGTHWILPNRDGGHLKDLFDPFEGFNQYNGTNFYAPSNISGFVFDSSSIALRPGENRMYHKVLDGGATVLAGFTTKTYVPYTQEIGRRMVTKGFDYGSALKKALNGYEEDAWTYDPSNFVLPNAYWKHRAKQEKARNSAVLYGEPTRRKDPPVEEHEQYERNCGGETCNYTWRLSTRIDERSGLLVVDGTEEEDVPGLPSVFFHTVEKTLPAGAEIVNISSEANTSALNKNISLDNLSIPDNRAEEWRFPAEQLQYDVYELPDGRQKVVVRHLALQYRNGGIDVFDDVAIRMEVRQRSYADVSVEQENNSTFVDVQAQLTSPHNGTALAVFEIRNRTWKESREINRSLTAGRNGFSWRAKLQPGKYEARFYVSADDNIGPVTEVFRVKEPARPVVDIKTPAAVDRSGRFPVRIKAENRGGMPTTLTVAVNGSQAVQTDFLEQERYRFTLAGGEEEVEKLTMRAFKKGNASVTAQIEFSTTEFNISDRFRVEESAGFEEVVSAVKRLFRMERWYEDFEVEQQAGRVELRLARPEGELRIVKTPEREVKELAMGAQGIEVVKEDASRYITFRNPDGKVRIEKKRGRRKISQEGTVSDRELQKMRNLLQEESQKLVNRYYWGRRSGAEGQQVIP